MQGGVNRGLGRLEGGGGPFPSYVSPERVFFPPLGELEGESWLQFGTETRKITGLKKEFLGNTATR